MPGVITKLCSVLQDIIFRKTAKTWNANMFKKIMNIAFIIFEKIAVHFDILTEIYIDAYEEVITAELSMINIQDSDKVIIIGSGAIPVTAILIARKTKAQITTIDIDPEAVARATLLIHRLGLQKQVNVMLADGFSYPVQSFSSIFILYGVSEQEGLLKTLSQHIEDTKIIVRTTMNNLKTVLDNINTTNHSLEIKNQTYTTALGLVYSYFIVKKT